MALTLPELKHEYIFQLDTEETKNSVFDQCREEAKEAAYSTFGTNQNDAEYQPSPIKDPDYMMDYCTSDGHDYLKDYRLIWGYGIGIIEQDVICSLTTGEHLAEGTEACDTYEAENAAGENTDWKRGTWIKFSGNRNVSPTRIGEVVLPDYIISLKDLCVALTSTDEVVVEGFNTNNIINMDNMFGKESSSNYRYYIISDFNFDSAKTLNYAFKCAHFVNFPYDINNRNIGGISLFERVRIDNDVTEVNMKLYSNMFYNFYPPINNKFVFEDCDKDISFAFCYADIDDFPIINFTNVTYSCNQLFYRITVLNPDNIKTLNLSSYVNPERSFDDYFIQSSDSINIRITFPNVEIINKGAPFISLSDSTIIFDNILIYNKIKPNTRISGFESNANIITFFSFNCTNITCIGTINGAAIGRINSELYGKLFTDSSKIKIIQDDLTYNDLKEFINYNNDFDVMPLFFLYNNYSQHNNTVNFNIDVLDFSESQIIGNLFYSYNYRYTNVNITNDSIDIVVDINKPILILGRYFKNITINNTSIDNILIGGNNNINLYYDLYDYVLKVNTENIVELYSDCYYIDTNNDVLSYNNFFKINKANNINYNTLYRYDHTDSNITIRNCNKFIINYSDTDIMSGIINIPSNFKLNIEVNPYLSNLIKYGNVTFLNIDNENDTVSFPNLTNVTDEYTLRYYGRFIDYPLSVLLNSELVYFANPYNCTYINDITETEINIHELAYSNYGINIDLSNFNINIEYTNIKGTYNDLLGSSMIDTISPNLKVNNITFLDYDYSGSDIAKLYLQYIESNNLIINFDINRYCYLYLYDLPNLHKFTINNFYGSIYANNFNYQNNINVLLLGNNNIIDDFLNLSAFDKLTQESINSIVTPSNYRSGATLTINTIPFQYITEEQKQALTNAGVTLVEYIPTETTE